MARDVSIISYAQNFEDVLLWRALGHIENGCYIDIGAQDPVVDSVSLAFYKAGWRGVHVEPTPSYANRLRDARPDETVIEAAVTDKNGLTTIYVIPDTGMSTGDKSIAETHLKSGYESSALLVPSIRLAKLFGLAKGDVHWLKIDVEGMEADVLRSWGKSAVRPWVLVIESTYPNSQTPTHQLWIDEVLRRDYREVFFDGLSRYFIHAGHDELAASFNSSPNIFDGFEIAPLHWAAREVDRSYQEHLETARAQSAQHETELRQRLDEVQVHARAMSEDANAALAERNQARDDAISARIQLDSASRHHNEALAALGKERERLRSDAAAATRGLIDAERAHSEALVDQWREWQVLDSNSQRAWVEREDRLRSDAEQVRSVAEKAYAANDLIRKAFAEPDGSWQRLGQALGVAQEDRARAALRLWTAIPSPSADKPEDPSVPIACSQEAVNYFQSSSLAELLSRNDLDFIQSAYMTILGRELDSDGGDYYAKRLLDGVSKIQVLNQLRQSRETRLFPDQLPGLNSALTRFRMASIFQGKQKAGMAIEAREISAANTPHVRQFMRYHDEEFIRVVSNYYLGRDPEDLAGEHFSARLRSGVSRQKILIDIAQSKEARARGRTAYGQKVVAVALFIDRIPVVRTAFAIAKFNLGIRHHLRDMRALQNHLYRLTEKIN